MANGFEALGIRTELVEKLKEHGISEPTPIQKQAIPSAYAGKDVIAEAQTGTGKTLAFVLTMLERIRTDVNEIQGLILAPTRELAIQITTELKKLAPVTGASVLAAYGGQDVERQLRKLENGIHIVVATPGRLLDHVRRESIQLHRVSMLVLDEADQMLHMGFLNEVEEIIRQIPKRRQTLLFSATMPQQVRQLAQEYMRQPEEISVRSKTVTLDEIEQFVILTSDRAKQDALAQAIIEYKPFLAMVFCRTKRRASVLNEALQERGFLSDELHGDLSQAKREQVMKRFREARIQILVATDIAARGIDVEGITHVFNYDIPHDAESYIHRIGRTGRAGQEGAAVTFASPRDLFYLELIEKGIKMTLPRLKSSAAPSARTERESDEPLSARANGKGQAPRFGAAREGAGGRGDGGGRRGTGRGEGDGGRRGAGRSEGDGGRRGAGRGESSEQWGAQRGEGGAPARRGAGRGESAGARRGGGGGAQRGEGRGEHWSAGREGAGGVRSGGGRWAGREDAAAGGYGAASRGESGRGGYGTARRGGEAGRGAAGGGESGRWNASGGVRGASGRAYGAERAEGGAPGAGGAARGGGRSQGPAREGGRRGDAGGAREAGRGAAARAGARSGDQRGAGRGSARGGRDDAWSNQAPRSGARDSRGGGASRGGGTSRSSDAGRSGGPSRGGGNGRPGGADRSGGRGGSRSGNGGRGRR